MPQAQVKVGDTITCQVHLKDQQYLVTGQFLLGWVVKDLQTGNEMHLPFSWEYQIVKSA